MLAPCPFHRQDECLVLYWFYNLHEVREACEEWRYHYNHYRDHSSLGKKAPRDFAAAHSAFPSPAAPESLNESIETGLPTMDSHNNWYTKWGKVALTRRAKEDLAGV